MATTLKEDTVFLSIVIPVFNEEKRLPESLKLIFDYCNNSSFSSEIILVDDGSLDNTKEIASEIAFQYRQSQKVSFRLISYQPNQGKGYAIKTGMLASKGKLALFTDADLSTPITETEKLINMIKAGYDIAIGSRYLPGSFIEIRQPLYRRLMGRIFRWLVNWLAISDIKDTQCGFKLFKREVIFSIFSRQRIYRFGFDVELLYIAQKLKYKIAEIPIRWRNSPDSKIRPISDSVSMLKDLIRIRLIHRNEKILS